jgi:hypothetical protein
MLPQGTLDYSHTVTPDDLFSKLVPLPSDHSAAGKLNVKEPFNVDCVGTTASSLERSREIRQFGSKVALPLTGPGGSALRRPDTNLLPPQMTLNFASSYDSQTK